MSGLGSREPVTESLRAAEIVDLQLRAYNARDIDAFCGFYALDAILSRLNDGFELCRGQRAIRSVYAALFEGNLDLHCEIKARIALGNIVIDHETVTGLGGSSFEAIAIYEVSGSCIQTVRFVRPRADAESFDGR